MRIKKGHLNASGFLSLWKQCGCPERMTLKHNGEAITLINGVAVAYEATPRKCAKCGIPLPPMQIRYCILCASLRHRDTESQKRIAAAEQKLFGLSI